MNKRVFEFADQILPNEKEFHKGDPKDWGYFFSGEELEKFAELIIRECAELNFRELGLSGSASFDVSRMIKQHFGVEE